MIKKLSVAERDALESALWKMSDELGVQIFKENGYMRHELKYGVNWFAKGTQSAKETKMYAKNMIKAANICEWINGKNFEIDYKLDESVTREEYIEIENEYLEMFNFIAKFD